MQARSRKAARPFASTPLAVLATALALAGCGGGTPKPAQAPPQAQGERFVFISAKDCAAAGKLNLQQCGDAVDAAIGQHIATAPTYPSQRSCEATEGGDRCERTDAKAFRPRLVAFLFTLSPDKVVAEPLYPPPGTEAGLRQANKKIVLTTDDTVTFSSLAIAAYETNKGDASAPAGGKK